MARYRDENGEEMDSYIVPRLEDYERDDPDTIRAMRSGYGYDDF